MKGTVGVIIPTYRPDEKLRNLLLQLKIQTRRPDSILLINTEEKLFRPALVKGIDGVQIHHISKKDFDHGGTRNLGAALLHTDLLLYMTMDAVPRDKYMVERLAEALDAPKTACAYARQLPAGDAGVLERYTRHFNYGSTSRVKTKADLQQLGIKTYFCSNVCAMYRRDLFEKLGKFPERAIFNEDMIFAAHAIEAGYGVAYCAEARVVHSHNYSGRTQLQRNFDLGVSQAENPEIFASVRSETEGKKLVMQEGRWLLRSGYALKIPELIWQSGCKYIGYRLGKSYRKLPAAVIRKLTMNKSYWQ